MYTLFTILEVRCRRRVLKDHIENFTWHLFHNKQRTIAGGTLHTLNYNRSVFIRVSPHTPLQDLASLVYKAVGREEPCAVAEMDERTCWIVAIKPLHDDHKEPLSTKFNLFEQPQDESKRVMVAPLIVPY